MRQDQRTKLISGMIHSVQPQYAVVFNGTEPRLIGTLDTANSAREVKDTVDAMLLSAGFSANYVSIAECFGKRFVVAHG